MKALRAMRDASAILAVAAILSGTLSPALATCTWQVSRLPRVAQYPGIPYSIRAFSPSDIWAASDDDRVLLHWDGAKWAVVTIPVKVPPNTILAAGGVTGTSDNDLWIDGIFVSISDRYAESLHFDGSHWTVTRMPSGYPPSQICLQEGPAIYGMQAFAPNDVWAIGQVCHVANGKAIIDAISEHWDGTRWKIVVMADPHGFSSSNVSSQMSGTSDHDIWAVGQGGEIEHFDGQRWSVAVKYGTYNAALQAIFAGAPNDVWAVGFQAPPSVGDPPPPSAARAFALHWNGSGWFVIPTPNEDDQHSKRINILTTVTGSGPNDVWAVGEDDRLYGPTSGNAQLLAMHWDGSIWSNESSDHLGPGGFYSIVDLGPRDVWALGSDNPNAGRGNGNAIAAFRCAH